MGTLLATTAVNAAELTGNVSLLSDYRLRGVSQSAGSEALQVNISSHFDNGLFVAGFGSNVDYGGSASLELDYILGYAGNFNQELGYAVALIYLTTQGHGAPTTDFLEISASLFYDGFTPNYVASDNTINTSETSEHLALSYEYSVTDNVRISLHAEHNFGEFYGACDINDYQNYHIALTGQFSDLEVSAKYIVVNTDSQDHIGDGLFRNDNTLIISVGKNF